jgi:hypothetical protein
MDMIVESVKLSSECHSGQRKKKSIVPDIPYLGHHGGGRDSPS